MKSKQQLKRKEVGYLNEGEVQTKYSPLFLNNGVRADGIQTLAQKPVMDHLNKAPRLTTGVGIMNSKLQDIANGKHGNLEACSIRNLALRHHHLGHTSQCIRNVLVVNKPHLKRT